MVPAPICRQTRSALDKNPSPGMISTFWRGPAGTVPVQFFALSRRPGSRLCGAADAFFVGSALRPTSNTQVRSPIKGDSMTSPIRVAVTGASGQIGYSLLFRLASGETFGPDRKVILQLQCWSSLPVAWGTSATTRSRTR